MTGGNAKSPVHRQLPSETSLPGKSGYYVRLRTFQGFQGKKRGKKKESRKRKKEKNENGDAGGNNGDEMSKTNCRSSATTTGNSMKNIPTEGKIPVEALHLLGL